MHQLQHLHYKFNVNDATGTAFEIRCAGPVFHFVAHAADFLDLAGGPFTIISGVCHNLHDPRRRRRRADHNAGFHQGLTLPGSSWPGGRKITFPLIEGHGNGPTATARTQS